MKITRAWLVDTSERVGFTFAETFVGSFGLEGIYALTGGHVNWGAVRIAEQAGLAAAAAVIKAAFAALKKDSASPASFAPAMNRTRKDRPTSKRRTTGVPATLTDEQNRRSDTAYKTGSAHARLHLLPEPAGRKGGALPSPRDDRDYRAQLPAKIPARVDNGLGITWGMLLNDRIGDCYPVALLHALQVLTGYTPIDADALAIYEQATGYDPTKTRPDGTNPTDQGTYGRQLFAWAKQHGLIGSYAAVPATRLAVKAGIAAHKAVLCEWALPTGAETEGDVWTMPRKGRAAGSWGGHATVEAGYTPTRNRNVTWGEYGTVTPSFEDAYLQAAWVIEVTPGTNVAAIMAKVRAA